MQSHHADFELGLCVFESPLVHKPGCVSQGALKQIQESHSSPNPSQGALKQTQESHPSPKWTFVLEHPCHLLAVTLCPPIYTYPLYHSGF